MSRDPHDVVKVFSGPMMTVEIYKQVLAEAEIESSVVGEALTASFGSALPDSIELWVNQEDFDKSVAAIKHYEERGDEHTKQHHHHPKNDPKPG